MAQVLAAAVDRLMDTEEKVRIAAIEGIAGAAMTDLSLLEAHLKPLAGIADRLRDVKAAVARSAAEQLLAIFKAYTMQREQGAVVSPGEWPCVGIQGSEAQCFPSKWSQSCSRRRGP